MIGPMGTRNRQRRRQKQSKQQTRRVHAGPRVGPPGAGPKWQSAHEREFIETMVWSGVRAHLEGDGVGLAHLLEMLDDGPPVPDGRTLVDHTVLGCVVRTVTAAWQSGWQPADVARIVRRELSGRHEELIVDGIGLEARGYAAATIDPAWADQLVAVNARVWWDEANPYADQRASASRCSRRDVLAVAVETLALLGALPDLPRLCPLPGEAEAGADGPGGGPAIDGRLLERVRALLAKAESTTFPEEAESLSAKAQELMARYSIDQAMLNHASNNSRAGVVGRRIGIDDPYAWPKAILLDHVAEANRSRAVWSEGMGFSTVFGARHDLGAIDLLFTSLLRQGTSAMLGHGTQGQRGRSAAFRRSFLLGYGSRIGERLREQRDMATAAASEVHGEGLLPVLVARASAVDEAIEEAFPEMTSKGARIRDYAGFVAGTAAADVASLGVAAQIEDASGT